ncbi:hypothetical protein TRAPUB_1234, partial [Trametes pubescens]
MPAGALHRRVVLPNQDLLRIRPKGRAARRSQREVEHMLRRAQEAVLHPDVKFEVFLEDGWQEKVKGKQPLRFSQNIVCIELTGPDLTDLSFVDLPGIVQNAESEVVNLVEDMVNNYIKGTSLILVTLLMSDDIENQKAARLAHLADPKGHRTI